MKVAVLGRTETLYKSAKSVVEAGHEVAVVATSEAEPHYSVDVSDFERLAGEFGCEFIQTTRLNRREVVEDLRAHACDVAISVNWQTVLDETVLNSFDRGVINCHAGDLPRYRGNATTNWAILNDEEELVYTLHYMNTDLDAGPILLQRSMPLTEETYIEDVYEFGVENVPEMYVEVLDRIECGTATPREQSEDPSEVLRCYPRHPVDSRLDWEESATNLARIVRATSDPLFGAFTEFDGAKLVVWRARPESPRMEILGTPGQVAERRPDVGEVAVVTGDGFLVLEEVETEEHGRGDPTEVIKSNRDRIGRNEWESARRLRRRVTDLEERLKRLEQ